jgi:hypothetical protein
MLARQRVNPYYLLTDKELAVQVGKMRIALMFKQPVTATHLRCLDEVARRLDALVRVTDDSGDGPWPSNDNNTEN